MKYSMFSFPVSSLGGYIELAVYESITNIKNVNYQFISFFFYLATAGLIIMAIAYIAVELSIRSHTEASGKMIKSKALRKNNKSVKTALETDDEIIRNERYLRYVFILSLIAWLALYGFRYLNLIPDDFLYSGALLPSAALFTIIFFLFWILYYFSARKLRH
jgi:hypothetical protein